MKKIEAIIEPYRLEEVKEALVKIGVEAMTITDTKGFVNRTGHTEIYRGAEFKVDFQPKVKIEIVLTDTQIQAATNVIANAGQTGKIGEEHIFVLPVEDAIRVRTEDQGKMAV